VAPNAIIATKYRVDENPASGIVRTRPVCPYPMEARWTGKGSVPGRRAEAMRAGISTSTSSNFESVIVRAF